MVQNPAQPVPITLESLSKTYHDHCGALLTAVQDFSLTVPAGQICGLVGPNGAGKSTVLKMMAGLEPPTTGRICLDGYDLARERDEALRRVGVVIQGRLGEGRRLFQPAGGKQSVWQSLMRHGPERAARAEGLLRELNLWERRDDAVDDLSQGRQRQVAIAGALVAEPAILLLDEPTQYLDVQTARRVEAWVRQLAHENGAAVVLATRQPQAADALCDRVVIMRQGRPAADQALSELCGLIQGEFYQIRLQGEIDAERAAWLGGLALATEGNDTILSVVAADQPALHGLLTKIRDLTIPLLSVVRVEPRLKTVLAYLMHAPLDELAFRA